jgi:Arc/MetJ-type ribon-helix-helix transcriptional regulator
MMKTITITLDDELLNIVETTTKTLEMTVSAFIQEALRLALQQQASQQEQDTAAPMIDAKGYAERTKELNVDELLHEGKYVAQQLLEDQGVASVALYISEMMVHSLEAERRHTVKR